MNFYQITAAMTNEVECEDEAAKRKLARLLSGASFSAFEKATEESFFFVSDMRGELLTLGCIAPNIEVCRSRLPGYLKEANIRASKAQVEEVSSREFRALMDDADQVRYANSREIIRRFDLGSLYSRRGGGFLADSNALYQEGLLAPSVRKSDLLRQVAASAWSSTAKPELDRIYKSVTPARFIGHPVHYLLCSDNLDSRKEMAKQLLSALFSKKRLRSRRYCELSVSRLDASDLKSIKRLYDAFAGGAILLRYRSDAREEAGYAPVDLEVLPALLALIREHRNKVLTVLCFPKSCAEEKALFVSELAPLSFVELCEGGFGAKQAERYLARKAERDGLATDDALFQPTVNGQVLYSDDLDKAYDEWFCEKLKTDVYARYRDVEPVREKKEERKIGGSLEKLRGMIGLGGAKAFIEKAVGFYKTRKQLAERGVCRENPAMHMVFTGNPGTAKTTVARLFASIMRENGILPRGHLVEVGRGDLVGKYVGWTAQNVKRRFAEAEGGVLFIDEAYSLVDDRNGLFGDEAINTIVQEMENRRRNVIVIFAGYPDRMEEFTARNPGLASRIAFRVPFEDYSAGELWEIAKYQAKQQGLTIEAGAQKKLHGIFTSALSAEDFGNGRFVRNLMERAVINQACRLQQCGVETVCSEQLATLAAEDFEDISPKTVVSKIKLGFGA